MDAMKESSKKKEMGIKREIVDALQQASNCKKGTGN